MSAHNPWDIEVEQAILGCCLADPKALEAAAVLVTPEAFYDPLHSRIFTTILRLMQAGAGGVSVVTVHAALKSDPGIVTVAKKMGSTQTYFDALHDSAPLIANVRVMAGTLNDLAERRKLEAIGKSLVDGAYAPPEDLPTSALAGAALEALLAVGTDVSQPAVQPYDVAGRVLAKAEAALRGEKPPSITTGLKKLDKAIGGGLQATDFMGVAGRSGMAKTTLVRSMGLAAARAGTPVLFFSKEMSDEQLTQGMLLDLDFVAKTKDEAAIHGWKFRAGALSEYEIRRLTDARDLLAGLPLEICDDADLTMGAITARSRAFQSRHRGKLGLIAVDYLQIVVDEMAPADASRENIVTRLANAHKRLAKMMDWAVLAAIQLKNKGDGKTPRDALPTAEDIRESGSIEMATDILVAPHRQAFFHKFKEPTVAHDRPEYVTWREKMDEIQNDLWLRGFKNRHGDPGALNLELWCDMAAGVIRDERPNRFRLGDPAEEIPPSELQF